MKKLSYLACLLAGCAVDGTNPGDMSSTETSTQTARSPRLEMRLTDAPGDFENVWVNIAGVAVESAEAGWIDVASEPQKFDLLTLQNDVTAALGGATLAAGTYGQLRLIVDEASVVVAGEEHPLAIASGAQTGIKINLDSTLEANMTYAITLDFDAAKSVKTTGQGYLMTPVIQIKELTATPMPADEAGSGDGSGSDGSGSGDPLL